MSDNLFLIIYGDDDGEPGIKVLTHDEVLARLNSADEGCLAEELVDLDYVREHPDLTADWSNKRVLLVEVARVVKPRAVQTVTSWAID
jgi:hypothetical protein